MIDFKLNEQHDIDFKNGDLVLISGAEKIRQQVEILLQTFLGEWFLDISHGIPYYEKILIKNANRAEIEAIIRDKLKGVEGVSSVPVFNIMINHPTRRIQAELELKTNQGLVPVKVRL